MRRHNCGEHPAIRDYGGEPFLFNILHAAKMNENFRTVLWTGHHLQLTLMSVPVCGEISVEMHHDVDQFLCVASGRATVYVGSCRGKMQEVGCVTENDAILIPAGAWHNIVNTGKCPLKLYSLYAPPVHPFGTAQRTNEETGTAKYELS